MKRQNGATSPVEGIKDFTIFEPSITLEAEKCTASGVSHPNTYAAVDNNQHLNDFALREGKQMC